MNKKEMLALLQRFEEIEKERNVKGNELYMSLHILRSTYGGFEYNMCAIEHHSEIYVTLHINGFPKPEVSKFVTIETFEDILNAVKEKRNHV
jgi:hypothetical protein